MIRVLPPVVRAYLSGLLLMACWLMPLSLAAQDLEPRRWTHLPVGTSVLGVGYAGQNADIYFNPVIGITDGSKLARTQSMMLAWQRGRTQNDVGADFNSWLLSWAMALGA